MAGQKNLRKMEPLISLKQASSRSELNRCRMALRALRRSLRIEEREGERVEDAKERKGGRRKRKEMERERERGTKECDW